MGKYNDLDLSQWREYTDIETDSLWIIDKRDNSGAHSGHYHGNFVPQIPHQLFSRYTKKGDWILDPFMGSGTSLIEAQRMGRRTKVVVADSQTCDMNKILLSEGINKVQFVIMHPPYWDIVKFSENPNDLSNCDSINEFLDSFGKVIDNSLSVLEKNRYCAVVIGDKYANSQVIPLGFYCMNLMMEKGFLLKAILVKNFGETKGKSNKQGIWRYRALASDFYIFKHEYIFVFKKVK